MNPSGSSPPAVEADASAEDQVVQRLLTREDEVVRTSTETETFSLRTKSSFTPGAITK